MTDKPQELIERYIYEVGTHLPPKGREDIQRELQSLIEDSVDERLGEKEINEEIVREVLREFGAPKLIAAQYRGETYLIGPNLFPIYATVTRVVLSVISGLYILILALQVWETPGIPTWPTLWGWGEDYFWTLITTLGLMTAIFAAIEWYFGDELALNPEMEAADWNPDSLPPLNDPDRINRFEMITGIIGSMIGISIALYMIAPDGPFGWFIAEPTRRLIPLLIAPAGIEIVMRSMLIWHGRWTTWLRVAEVGQQIFGYYVIYRFFNVEVITTIGIDPFIRFGLGISLIIGVIVIVVKIFQLIYRLRSGTPWSWSDLTTASSTIV